MYFDVNQADPLSLILFIVYVNDMTNDIKTLCGSTVIFKRSDIRHIHKEIKLQEVMNAIDNILCKMDLRRMKVMTTSKLNIGFFPLESPIDILNS